MTTALAVPELTLLELSQHDREGWGFFDCGGAAGHDLVELQCIDEEEVFDDDTEAWIFVRERALAGSTVHARALTWLAAVAPGEHALVMGHPEIAPRCPEIIGQYGTSSGGGPMTWHDEVCDTPLRPDGVCPRRSWDDEHPSKEDS